MDSPQEQALAGAAVVMLQIADIKRDPRAQPRVHLSSVVIERYAEDIANGDEFPPVTVFSGPDGAFLADGFHRTAAHEAAEKKMIRAEVHPGGLREAILHSVSANAAHGLQRTDEDKRRAVRRLLDDPEWTKWSDRAIARVAGVSHTMVAGMRAGEPEKATRTVRRGDTTYEMKTKRKRKPKPEKPQAPAQDPQQEQAPPATIVAGDAITPPWANPEALKAFADEANKQEPAAVVGMVIGIIVALQPSLPSPEGATQLLRTRGVVVSPNRLVNFGRWLEGIAFALDGR